MGRIDVLWELRRISGRKTDVETMTVRACTQGALTPSARHLTMRIPYYLATSYSAPGEHIDDAV